MSKSIPPVPLFAAFKQIIFYTIRVVLMGIVLARINRETVARHA